VQSRGWAVRHRQPGFGRPGGRPFRCRLPVTGSARHQACGRVCLGLIAASKQAGIPAGRVVEWGLAAMRQDRGRGIVGVTAGSPLRPGAGATGGSS